MSTRMFAAAIVMIAAAPIAASAAPPPRVVMAVDGIKEVRNLPAIVAESLGYFRDEGLTVTLMEGRDEVPTVEMLKDGRVDASMAFYHHTIMSQADGVVTEAVIDLGISPALKMMVANRMRETIRTPADLKGHRIITGGVNSGKTTAANWLMAGAGLGMDDYQRLPIGSRDANAKALADGEADAIMAHEPDASFYAEHGIATTIADLTSPEDTRKALGSVFPTTALYLTRDFVEAHPDIVQHLVNALMRSLAFINSHGSDEILAALPKNFPGKERETYRKDLALDLKMFATNGLLPEADARTEMKIMVALQDKYRATNFGQTYTNTFVEAALRGRK